jgi:hypothetical protein
MSLKIPRRVSSSSEDDSRARSLEPPKIVVTGVRSSCDRTPMNVSRTRSRRSVSVTSRMTTIVSSPAVARPTPTLTG